MQVILTSKTDNHVPLRAVFLPEQGMTLASYCKGNVEVIDQKTREDFERSRAGLGCIIGPHFHKQKEEWIVPVDERIFPHARHTKQQGFKDPFSHGIGRYAPWRFTATENSISARLSGSDLWHGIPLSELEGTDFEMSYDVVLSSKGLEASMRVSSERVSTIGMHFYYALPQGNATVTSLVQDQYNFEGVFRPMESRWTKGDLNHLEFNLNEFADYGFLPFSQDHSGEVLLQTATHQMRIRYRGESEEVSCQLWHPKGASFVCIEPISAKNPRRLTALASAIHVQIEII